MGPIYQYYCTLSNEKYIPLFFPFGYAHGLTSFTLCVLEREREGGGGSNQGIRNLFIISLKLACLSPHAPSSPFLLLLPLRILNACLDAAVTVHHYY